MVLLLSVAVTGCETFQSEPLPEQASFATALFAAPLHLTIAQSVSLAVEHSPHLAIERRKMGVAHAQAYAAGLLPDPQLTASADFPTVHGPGLVTGYALGLSEDLQAFLTEPSRAEGGEARKKQARLDLLWAEWQTIQKTADLYVQKYFTDRKAALLAADAGVLTAQAARSQRALEAHNTTIDVAGSDLSAALDIEIRRDAAARAAMASDADLKTELNVEPNAELTLADPANPGTISKDEVAAGLKAMVNRRPDLLALQAGYHAQEEAVRTAILQQFPAVNFGMNRASDTTNVRTIGLAATIDVPILGNTQAKIRTERATREQLRSEYQARLDEAESDAWRLWRSLGLLREQIRQLEQSLPELRRMAQTGEEAYAAGNLAPATYVLLRTSLTSRESDLLDLKAMLWNDSTALRALLGLSPLVRGTPP